MKKTKIKALHTSTRIPGIHKAPKERRQAAKGSSKSGPAKKKT